MHTGQISNQDSQRMVENYTSQVLINAKPTRLYTFRLHPSGEECIMTCFLTTYLPPIVDQIHIVQLGQPCL